MLVEWIARSAAARRQNAALPEEAQQVAPAGAAAEPHIVAEHTAAAADIAAEQAAAGIAGPHTAAAAVVAPESRTAAEAAVAKRPAPAEGRRIPAEVVATEPPVFRGHIARAAEALQPQKLPLPAPVRRKMGNLSSRGEHRVRIADISS
jgi:hypothetical protein